MGQGYLLDTNAIIDYCGVKLPAVSAQKMNNKVNAGFNTSPVVKIEVLGFDGPPADMQKLEGILSLANMLYIDDAII